MKKKLRVLYIAGDGRSGSTLLARILGQLDSFAVVGELRHIWQRSFVENQLCGCGFPFQSCSFWQKVLEYSFGGNATVIGKEAVILQKNVEYIRHIPMMYLAPSFSSQGIRREKYKKLLLKLYHGVDQLVDGKIIVNSSKGVSSIYFLSTLHEVDLSVIHLVRDSRAVAFSWMRRKIRPEIIDKMVYMPTYRPGSAAWSWLIRRNLLSEMSRFVANRYIRIRYEDLICSPRQTIEKVLALMNVKNQSLDFIQGNMILLNKDNHTVAGNPMRFQRGEVTLNLDDEWKTHMGIQEKRLVTAITWPLLLKYGYFGVHSRISENQGKVQ